MKLRGGMAELRIGRDVYECWNSKGRGGKPVQEAIYWKLDL